MDADIKKLKDAGFRITNQRVGIIEALRDARGKISIEDLHRALQVDADLVTVYRNVEVLEEAGIARRSFRVDGVVTFEYISGHVREFEITSRTDAHREKLPPDLNAELNAVFERVELALSIRGYQRVTSSVEFFAK